MLSYILIAIGGALGSVARFWVANVIADRTPEAILPWGTIIINITGSIAIGFFASIAAPEGRIPVPIEWRQFFMVGICGGYTTFSAFSLQTLVLAQNGHLLGAGANIGLSVLLCLAGVWLGHTAALMINQ